VVATKLTIDQNKACIRLKKFRGKAAWLQPFPNLFMKKFLVFFIFLALLILSEYFLLNELLSYRRLSVLLPSLLGTVFFIYAVIKFIKKYMFAGKQSEAHS
jgi:hypothetical protein